MADTVISSDVVALIRLRPTCRILTQGDIFRRAEENPEVAPLLASELTRDQKFTRRKVGMFLKKSASEQTWITKVPGCSRTNPQYHIVMEQVPGV